VDILICESRGACGSVCVCVCVSLYGCMDMDVLICDSRSLWACMCMCMCVCVSLYGCMDMDVLICASRRLLACERERERMYICMNACSVCGQIDM
jgi:hypothetical protein